MTTWSVRQCERESLLALVGFVDVSSVCVYLREVSLCLHLSGWFHLPRICMCLCVCFQTYPCLCAIPYVFFECSCSQLARLVT